MVTIRVPMLGLLFCACILTAALLARAYSGNPHGKSIRVTCSKCHASGKFVPIKSSPDFDHATAGFPLKGMHAGIYCRVCHSTLVFSNVGTQCADCHADIHRRQLGADCADCHSPRGWREITRSTDRHTNRFPLLGAHAAVECESCHTGAAVGQFRGLRTDCDSCHHSDYLNAVSVDHQAGGFSLNCETCHSVDNWFSNFNHDSSTGFVLSGAHSTLDCRECHTNLIFQGTSSDCYSCHSNDYNNTSDPNHAAAGYSHDCTQCHTTSNWSSADFSHNETSFPLTGAHTTLGCQACHSSGQYAGLPSDCYACHSNDYNSTSDPNHAAAGFSHDCAQCHTTSGWGGADFNHNETGFSLTGAHTSLGCQACHSSGQYAGLPSDCYSCHANDYNSTSDPNHAAAGYSHDCTQCHTTSNWDSEDIDHSETGFSLTGAHTSLGCQACHSSGQYAGMPSDCYSCHSNNYNSTSDPNHAAAGYSHECTQCHTTSGWSSGNFSHNETSFPLTGAHTTLGCQACHSSGQYNGLPSDCYSCHSNDFNSTSDPGHAAAGFSHYCTQCHTTTRWSGANFNHNVTDFPLTGAHTALGCQACHSSGQYAGMPSNCYSCHSDNYNSTSDPNHVAAGYSQDCMQCHTTSGWGGASFNHSETSFPLTGAHTALGCQACHSSGQYNGLPSDCYSCHSNDYNSTSDPNHAAAGFPQNCTQCHTTSGWSGADFSHNQTSFPLTGAHTALGCQACHSSGQYAGLPSDCYSCHSNDYNGTSDPNHAAAGFPHNCTQCHTTSGWSGASFTHSSFPIYSGRHSSAWSACSDCHTNPSNFAVFSCTTCHGRTSTDSHHGGVSGYVYNSANCYACHPNGRAD